MGWSEVSCDRSIVIWTAGFSLHFRFIPGFNIHQGIQNKPFVEERGRQKNKLESFVRVFEKCCTSNVPQSEALVDITVPSAADVLSRRDRWKFLLPSSI